MRTNKVSVLDNVIIPICSAIMVPIIAIVPIHIYRFLTEDGTLLFLVVHFGLLCLAVWLFACVVVNLIKSANKVKSFRITSTICIICFFISLIFSFNYIMWGIYA